MRRVRYQHTHIWLTPDGANLKPMPVSTYQAVMRELLSVVNSAATANSSELVAECLCECYRFYVLGSLVSGEVEPEARVDLLLTRALRAVDVGDVVDDMVETAMSDQSILNAILDQGVHWAGYLRLGLGIQNALRRMVQAVGAARDNQSIEALKEAVGLEWADSGELDALDRTAAFEVSAGAKALLRARW